ncbi:MAG: PHP domain-containing protein [Kiritimatiellae bacterium]|nr:PHP domain-containing protein [Kiritimatiellia bacterium]
MKVDFHIHSTASDGTVSPAAISRRTASFAAVALTDHDTTDGIAEFLSEGTGPVSRMKIAGAELSIDPGEGFDRFHLLALDIDPANPSLRALLERVIRARDERNRRMTERFNAIGIDIKPESKGSVLARPHYAMWLVKHGYSPNIAEAFAKYLLPWSPEETKCYVRRESPPQEESFAAVHAAGGICVMAHPKFWRNEWKRAGCDFAVAEHALCELKEKGLDGLEAIYAANTPLENVEFTRIADRAGLLKTAGSDFHGLNKPRIPIGMEVDEAFAAPLLERLGY